MNAEIIASWSFASLAWLEAEAFAPIFGEKAARLLTVPRQWTPPFLAISASVVEKIVLEGVGCDALQSSILPAAKDFLAGAHEVIVRSSIVGETIWDRGTYNSEPLSVEPASDFAERLFQTICTVRRSARGEKCGAVVQLFEAANEMGEFGNLLRISRTRDHWEFSVRTPDGVMELDRFNSQRDIAPDANKPLLARVGLPRERLFGSVAAWINNELLRGSRIRVNCEWIRSGDRFFVVQIDGEDEDLHGINPMQLFVEPSVVVSATAGSLLKPASAESCKQWDKLAVLDQLFDETAPVVPTLFCVPLSDLHGEEIEAKLEAEFSKLLKKNIVVRTSIRAGEVKIMNLPKTDCLTASEAARWCVKTARSLKELHSDTELAFIAHRYIGSRASAWVRASPNEPIVEVHGTWGLPDALQFCAYDIWEVHAPREEITEYANYKSHVLLLQSDGSWKYERVKNDIARFQSLTRNEVLEISRRSYELARRLNSPCHIMWFVGCVSNQGDIVNIPWYWTPAHETENPDRGSYQILTIEVAADLDRLAEMKRRYRRLAISLKPKSVELLRDNKFLEQVSDVAKALNLPVMLAGSTLAHAFYQLRKNGCLVIPEVDKDHQRTRRQMNFGKLVRDKIPEKIERQQEQQSVAIIPPTARIGFLVGKFIEEVLEVREADNPIDRRIELADVLEVLRALIAQSGEEFENVVAEADTKKDRVGGFDDGKLLLTTRLPKAGTDLITKTSSISTDVIAEASPERRYRVPFTFFGFAELGFSRTLEFPDLGVDVQITLQRDCIEIDASRRPEQLRLDLSSPT
jgi:predicted house-cleaning noncanonical NTP pyrophosphatase (MazG superfamily)